MVISEAEDVVSVLLDTPTRGERETDTHSERYESHGRSTGLRLGAGCCRSPSVKLGCFFRAGSAAGTAATAAKSVTFPIIMRRPPIPFPLGFWVHVAVRLLLMLLSFLLSSCSVCTWPSE